MKKTRDDGQLREWIKLTTADSESVDRCTTSTQASIDGKMERGIAKVSKLTSYLVSDYVNQTENITQFFLKSFQKILILTGSDVDGQLVGIITRLVDNLLGCQKFNQNLMLNITDIAIKHLQKVGGSSSLIF